LSGDVEVIRMKNLIDLRRAGLLLLSLLCGTVVSYAQRPCATQGLEPESLTNQLRAREGLPEAGRESWLDKTP
jgi:hypothetical protein